VERFQRLQQRLASSSITSQEAPSTDLECDRDSLHLALLLLHSEVNVTFSTSTFGPHTFVAADCKIRRTPCGDDAVYKSFRMLQQYLPRGCCFIQSTQRCASGGGMAIYRGLFSLRKFYGKEGIEDDGAGITPDMLQFKLRGVLAQTDHLMCMEKVNGRAGSMRFFLYGGEHYLLIGTKLSHVVCRVELLEEGGGRVVPPDWLITERSVYGATSVSGEKTNTAASGESDDGAGSGGDNEEEEEEDITQAVSVVSKGGIEPF
jgi:hypothetical protein